MAEKPYVVAENNYHKIIVRRGSYYTFLKEDGDPLPTKSNKWRGRELLDGAIAGGYHELEKPRLYKPKKG